MRGEESEIDEEFCRNLCQLWRIPLYVERLQRPGRSEADLRKLRYERIEQISEKIGSKIFLTGHTLDDQVETMLFRLFRGTGPAGLLGIPPYRKVSEQLVVMRPMLSITKVDCMRFLARNGISARFDSSNQDDVYSRNFIRNQIMPLVETRFPGFAERAEQLRKVIEADESMLNCLSRDAELDLIDHSCQKDIWYLDEFNELPLSLRRRVLYESLKQRNIECEFARIETLLEMIDQDGEAAICLNQEWEIRLFRGELRWQKRLDKRQVEEPCEISIPVRPEGLTLIHQLGLAIKVEKCDARARDVKIPGCQEHELVGDLSSVGNMTVRLRQAGDQIQPLGMGCMVRLKKFLHTHKSSKTLSFGGRVLVLANASEVLWVPGCGISQRIAIGDRATHRIHIMRIAPDQTSFC